MKMGFPRIRGCLLALSSVAGCADLGASEETVAQTTQAVVGVDEFLYLRCNATGWGADTTTRLSETDQAGVFAIEYDVSADYMTTGGDQCALTRTNSANGWGSQSASFGAAGTGIVSVPGQWSIGAVNSTPATIRYPALGRYRATVNWANSTVAIAAVSTNPPPAAYYYLRCNATSWDMGAANRFAAVGGQLALTYSVGQSWMVSSGDQCVVTRTNRLDGWGTSQGTLGTAAPTTVVVPAGGGVDATLVSAGQQFGVRYPSVGTYQAKLDPLTGQLRIMVPGSDVPETGLHGRVESLGGNRVRVTYDFQTSEQLQDFVSTNPDTTGVSVTDGRLIVQSHSDAWGFRAASLVKGFRVDSLQYQSELLAGDHINVYVGAAWDGGVYPARGYGAIHRWNGRVLVGNQVETTTSATVGVATGKVYTGRIDTTEQGLAWTLDGDTQSLVMPYYGGTARNILLGGLGSTVAFDNLVLEGTVAGFEADGTETNPDQIHGTVANLPDGRVRISYDFSDPQQKYDFVVNNQEGTRRELADGRLIVSHIGNASSMKVALYKYSLRVDRLEYRAELFAGLHSNVYVNTLWADVPVPATGCAAIHQYNGRMLLVNGTGASDTTPITLRTPYQGELLVGATGLVWTLNGAALSVETECYAGLDGRLGLGSLESDVAFDDLIIEGQLQ